LKTYRPPRNVAAEIKRRLTSDHPSPGAPSALARVLKLLCESRNYERAGIFLAMDGREVPRAFSGVQAAPDAPRPELSVPIKIASHSLGSLRVQLAPGRAFTPAERVLLHEVAELLAIYLTTKGKYVLRKVRESLRQTPTPDSGEPRAYQPASERRASLETRRAAAGEKSRS
jgi:hypothetical protein